GGTDSFENANHADALDDHNEHRGHHVESRHKDDQHQENDHILAQQLQPVEELGMPVGYFLELQVVVHLVEHLVGHLVYLVEILEQNFHAAHQGIGPVVKLADQLQVTNDKHFIKLLQTCIEHTHHLQFSGPG